MNGPYLLLDVSFLANRAFYALPGLAHDGDGTSVIFGVLRDVLQLQEQFRTSRIVFAFDGEGQRKRQLACPSYKANRGQCITTEQSEAKVDLHRQLFALRDDLLPAIGFKNLFHQRGYEADDVLASLVQELPAKEKAVIVSSDHDLYQLLAFQNVSIWNPSKQSLVTAESFTKHYEIEPARWHCVKAIAGCNSDNVRGVYGVGEITAARFLLGKLKADSIACKKIVEGEPVWKENLALVQLPYPGTKSFKIVPDGVTKEGWRDVCNRFGLRTLLHLTAFMV